MGYVDENLLPGERIEYRAHLHWTLFAPSVALAIIGVVAAVFALFAGDVPIVLWSGVALVVLAGIVAIPAWVRYATSEFAVTNRRVLVKLGLIRRHTVELLLQKVETVGVRQSLAGRMFDYGDIIVTGTGGTQETFQHLSDPLEFRRRVQHHSAPLPHEGGAHAPDELAAGGPFCTACGAANPAGSSFCCRCGKRLVTAGA